MKKYNLILFPTLKTSIWYFLFHAPQTKFNKSIPILNRLFTGTLRKSIKNIFLLPIRPCFMKISVGRLQMCYNREKGYVDRSASSSLVGVYCTICAAADSTVGTFSSVLTNYAKHCSAYGKLHFRTNKSTYSCCSRRKELEPEFT